MFSFFKKKSGPPDAAIVMKRAIILKHTLVKGLASPEPNSLAELQRQWTENDRIQFDKESRALSRQQIDKLIESGLWNEMEQYERDFMLAGPAEITQQSLLNAIWLAESAVCLLWALGFVDEIPPYDEQSDPKLTNRLPLEQVNVLLSKATLRSSSTVSKQRDLAELWHWRSRTRQLQEAGRMPANLPGGRTIEEVIRLVSEKAGGNHEIPAPIGNDFPAFGKSYRDLTAEEFSVMTSIAMERHRAFNWLCGYAPNNRWSETPTDT